MPGPSARPPWRRRPGGRWRRPGRHGCCLGAAIAETRAALAIARRLPYRFLVTHLGMPSAEQVPPNDNQAAAARRSIEDIAAMAAEVGVRIALEVIPNDLSSAATLVQLVEDDLDDLG